MAKYVFMTLGMIVAALAALFFWIGNPRMFQYAAVVPPSPHFFNNPERGIVATRVAAVYFIPKNKEHEKSGTWREMLESNLALLQKFHSLQFQGRSAVSVAVYPEPVIGRRGQLFYDTKNTSRGNPKALLSIAEELEERVFSSSGDLYRPDFWKQENGTYPVLFILYEGVGASGGIIAEHSSESVADIARELGIPESVIFKVPVSSVDGFFLLSRSFLSEAEYRSFGASLLAHEFYHTLGVPDGYDAEDETPTTVDIMGLGRFRPIEKTYLQRKTLRALGL